MGELRGRKRRFAPKTIECRPVTFAWLGVFCANCFGDESDLALLFVCV